MLAGRRLLRTLSAAVPLTGAACWLAPVAHADSGPVILGDDVPTTVQADVPATFDVTLADDAGTVGTIAWNFGDGSVGSTGADTSHAWAAPGTYLVTLTTVDSVGLPLSQSFSVTVTPAPAVVTAATPAATTPALTFGATQSRARWTSRQGTVFTLAVNLSADVTMRFARRGQGALAIASRPLGTVSARVLPGGQRIDFHGLLRHGDTLAPGHYVVTMIAGTAGSSTAPVTLDFTVQRPKRENHDARGVRHTRATEDAASCRSAAVRSQATIVAAPPGSPSTATTTRLRPPRLASRSARSASR